MSAARYALYFVPAPGTPLAEFGARVLGDSPPAPELSHHDWARITAEPRRYGFHATLKAPFVLAPKKQDAELRQAAEGFAANQQRFEAPPLKLTRMGTALALMPTATCDRLSKFAADVVQHFDAFRAPLSPEDRARRLQSPLSERERTHLDRWGYPYVFEDFRFHMTLTGSLGADEIEEVEEHLQRAYVQRVGARALQIDAVALLAEPKRGAPFVLLNRYPLAR